MYIENSDEKKKSDFQLRVSYSRKRLLRIIVFIIVLLFTIILTKSCTDTIRLDRENPYIKYKDEVINIDVNDEYIINYELINSTDDINMSFFSDCDYIRLDNNKIIGLREGSCKIYSSYFLNGSFKEDILTVNIR